MVKLEHDNGDLQSPHTGRSCKTCSLFFADSHKVQSSLGRLRAQARLLSVAEAGPAREPPFTHTSTAGGVSCLEEESEQCISVPATHAQLPVASFMKQKHKIALF